MWSSWFNGLFVGAGLIIAIGAQNAFVLQRGLRNEHPWWVATVCALCDLGLIGLGVLGLGALLATHAGLMQVARWAGVAFLCWQAWQAWQRVRYPAALQAGGEASASSLARVVGHAGGDVAQPACVPGHGDHARRHRCTADSADGVRRRRVDGLGGVVLRPRGWRRLAGASPGRAALLAGHRRCDLRNLAAGGVATGDDAPGGGMSDAVLVGGDIAARNFGIKRTLDLVPAEA